VHIIKKTKKGTKRFDGDDDFDYEAFHREGKLADDAIHGHDDHEVQEDPNAILEPNEEMENQEQIGYKTV
jgi:hypothetical protein